MQPLDEDWNLLLGLLPSQWQQQAVLSGACERLRGFSSASSLLRTLLLHVGNGYSLRETVVKAKAAGIAAVSDVALMKRLQKAEGWLHDLCVSLLQESGWEMPAETHGFNVRALDGTLVKEPGRSGSLWRIHYSVRIPSLVCDHFELTPTKGAGTGETLGRFAASPGDLVLADRGFCKPAGVEALDRGPTEHFGSAIVERRRFAIRVGRRDRKAEGDWHGTRVAGLGTRNQRPDRRETVCHSQERGGCGAGAPPYREKGAAGRTETEARNITIRPLRDGLYHCTGKSLQHDGSAGMVSSAMAN